MYLPSGLKNTLCWREGTWLKIFEVRIHEVRMLLMRDKNVHVHTVIKHQT